MVLLQQEPPRRRRRIAGQIAPLVALTATLCLAADFLDVFEGQEAFSGSLASRRPAAVQRARVCMLAEPDAADEASTGFPGTLTKVDPEEMQRRKRFRSVYEMRRKPYQRKLPLEKIYYKREIPKDVLCVFDKSARKEMDTFTMKWHGDTYTIFGKNSTYMVDVKGVGVKTGRWLDAFDMPEEAFPSQKRRLLKNYFKKVQKAKRHMGVNSRMKNGRWRHQEFLRRDEPFVSDPEFNLYKGKYVERAAWRRDPNEVEWRAQKQRARELRYKVEVKMEQQRIDRMVELGVWTGQQAWLRDKLRDKVNVKGTGRLREGEVEDDFDIKAALKTESVEEEDEDEEEMEEMEDEGEEE